MGSSTGQRCGVDQGGHVASSRCIAKPPPQRPATPPAASPARGRRRRPRTRRRRTAGRRVSAGTSRTVENPPSAAARRVSQTAACAVWVRIRWPHSAFQNAPRSSGRQVRHARLDAVGVVLGIGELRRAGPRDYEPYGLRPAPLPELDADLVRHPGAQAVAEDDKWRLAQVFDRASTRAVTSWRIDWPFGSSIRELRPGSSTGSSSTVSGSDQPWNAHAPMPAWGMASTRMRTFDGSVDVGPWSTHGP